MAHQLGCKGQTVRVVGQVDVIPQSPAKPIAKLISQNVSSWAVVVVKEGHLLMIAEVVDPLCLQVVVELLRNVVEWEDKAVFQVVRE